MLVGIAGHKQAGKTTLANGLSRHFWWLHTSFAEPIREFACRILGVTLDELERIKEQPIDWLDGITPRRIMQLAGTEFGRQMLNPDIWVRSALRRASKARGCVLSDVRFANEAEAIRKRNGVVIRLHRGDACKDAHASETPIPDDLVDIEIHNSGSVSETLDYAIEQLGKFGCYLPAPMFVGAVADSD